MLAFRGDGGSGQGGGVAASIANKTDRLSKSICYRVAPLELILFAETTNVELVYRQLTFEEFLLRILIPSALLLVFVFGALYVASTSWLFAPLGELTSNEVAVRQVKAEIYEKFFQIFLTVTAIMSGFAVTIAFAVFNLLKAEVAKTLERSITTSVLSAQTYALLITFTQLSMDDFWDYDSILEREMLDQPINELERKTALTSAARAFTKANIGIEVFERLSPPQQESYLEDAAQTIPYLNLLNHHFYSRCALFLLDPEAQDAGNAEIIEDEATQLLATANKQSSNSNRSQISGIHDSVITCLYCVSKRTGNRNLRLKSIKLAQIFTSTHNLSVSTSFAQATDIENVKRILANELSP